LRTKKSQLSGLLGGDSSHSDCKLSPALLFGVPVTGASGDNAGDALRFLAPLILSKAEKASTAFKQSKNVSKLKCLLQSFLGRLQLAPQRSSCNVEEEDSILFNLWKVTLAVKNVLHSRCLSLVAWTCEAQSQRMSKANNLLFISAQEESHLQSNEGGKPDGSAMRDEA
jgi:hypothetical protein